MLSKTRIATSSNAIGNFCRSKLPPSPTPTALNTAEVECLYFSVGRPTNRANPSKTSSGVSFRSPSMSKISNSACRIWELQERFEFDCLDAMWHVDIHSYCYYSPNFLFVHNSKWRLYTPICVNIIYIKYCIPEFDVWRALTAHWIRHRNATTSVNQQIHVTTVDKFVTWNAFCDWFSLWDCTPK